MLWLCMNVLYRPDLMDFWVVGVITWRWRSCVRVLLMSSAAVNGSIRLFLNALVTSMGHSARESAHSAERAPALAGHQRRAHAHACTNATHQQWRALTYPFVCLFSTFLACVSCWQSNNMSGAESFVVCLRERDHLFIKANACYSVRGFA